MAARSRAGPGRLRQAARWTPLALRHFGDRDVPRIEAVLDGYGW